MQVKSIIATLLKSKEPAVRLKTYIRLLNYDYETKEVKKIINNLKDISPIVSKLFFFSHKWMNLFIILR